MTSGEHPGQGRHWRRLGWSGRYHVVEGVTAGCHAGSARGQEEDKAYALPLLAWLLPAPAR